MAGCLPMHFPSSPPLAGDDEGRVPDAWRDVEHRRRRCPGHHQWPIRREIGANSTFNTLGNSDRAPP